MTRATVLQHISGVSVAALLHSSLLTTLAWAEPAPAPAAAPAPAPVAPTTVAPTQTAPSAAPQSAAPQSTAVAPAPATAVAPAATPVTAAPAPTPTPAPAIAAAPAPSAAPAAAPPEEATRPQDRVWAHFGANYPNAVLEGRSVIEFEDWRALCTAPCKQYLDAAELEVRVSAPGMTTSNPFRLESGRGRVHFRVSGGSDTVKTLGITGLTAGIPVMLGGMAMFGYGGIDDKDTLRDIGLVTLSVGAVAVIASIPLLLSGTTRVYNSKSDRIATIPQFRF